MKYTPHVEETEEVVNTTVEPVEVATPKEPVEVPSPKEPVAAPTNSRTNDKRVKATNVASSKDSNLAGSYRAVTTLNMRHGAGMNEQVLTVIPKNAKVRNYGFYTEVGNAKWLYVQTMLNSVVYSGFCSSEYLEKI